MRECKAAECVEIKSNLKLYAKCIETEKKQNTTLEFINRNFSFKGCVTVAAK